MTVLVVWYMLRKTGLALFGVVGIASAAGYTFYTLVAFGIWIGTRWTVGAFDVCSCGPV